MIKQWLCWLRTGHSWQTKQTGIDTNTGNVYIKLVCAHCGAVRYVEAEE